MCEALHTSERVARVKIIPDFCSRAEDGMDDEATMDRMVVWLLLAGSVCLLVITALSFA
jgi:hypothetical protein